MTDAPTQTPSPGDILADKYQVEQVLGKGGMGVVVGAFHTAMRKRVAVKLLLPEATRMPDARTRFLQEAQAAGAIGSEHVARVLDVGTLADGTPFMVMEYLEGTDLRKLLKQRGPLPMTEAIDFVLQAIEALAEAHSLGIWHRDLKPANIFLTHRKDGSPLVKVLDFGLSKVVRPDGPSERSLTATDLVAGSPEYMSPEQVRSLRNVDYRTDIWAIGVVLYELLTRKRPFTGPTSAAVCASIAADTPVPLRAHRPDLPEALEQAIFACLEKDPDRRTRTMGDLAKSLSPFATAASLPLIERAARLSSDLASRGPISRSGPRSGEQTGLPPQAETTTGHGSAQPVPSSVEAADGTTTIADGGRSHRTAVTPAPISSTSPGGWGRTGQQTKAPRTVRLGVVASVGGAAILVVGALLWLTAGGGAAENLAPGSMEPVREAAPAGETTHSETTALDTTASEIAPSETTTDDPTGSATAASETATGAEPATTESGKAATTTFRAPAGTRKPVFKPTQKKPALSLDKPL